MKSCWGSSNSLQSSKVGRRHIGLERWRLSRRHRSGRNVHCRESRRYCSRTTGQRCFIWNGGLASSRSLGGFNDVTPIPPINSTSRLDKETTRTRRIHTGSWCPNLLPRKPHSHYFTRSNIRKWLCVSIVVILLTTFPIRHTPDSLHFSKTRLTVFTAFSALPFD